MENTIGPPVLSPAGTLAYVSGTRPGVELVWVDRDGTEDTIDAGLANYRGLELSPDYRHVALWVGLEMQVYDLTRGTVGNVADEGGGFQGIWTLDGKSIAYRSTRDGPSKMFLRAATGVGPVEQFRTTLAGIPRGWTDDGQTLIFDARDPEAPQVWNIYSLSLSGDASPEVLVENGSQPTISPDERWITYYSPGSGLVLEPFPNPDDRRWPIGPAWDPKSAADSRELFYLSAGSACSQH